MNISILHSKVLVVEGKDDQGFFAAFLKHLGIDGVQVEPVGGKDNLRPNLKALRNTPGFSNVEFLGVVRDADTNARGAFQSVRDALKGAGLGFPRRAATPVGRSPRVAVLILPGSGSRGELEDVCLGAVRNDPALACVDEYFRCLRRSGVSTTRASAKAKVQTFLASRQKPGLRLGEAAQKGYWPWDSVAFNGLARFLRLFSGSRRR